jgi:hypothetical protein
LSTINPILPDPGSNPGRRGGKPATNRLSYGADSLLVKCGHSMKLASWILCTAENKKNILGRTNCLFFNTTRTT